MKITSRLCYLFFFLVLACALQSQPIANYGSSSISKQDFLRAFLKNNTERKSEKAYRDYLELYIRFKLKVKAAYDLKLDTLPTQEAELMEYRRQITEGFLHDESSFKQIVDEAFYRSQKDIQLAHIFIAVAANNSIGNPDTLSARKLADSAFNELKKGTDFSKVATVYSSDSSVGLNHGNIGYITAFTLPYALENLAYSTPVGGFSRPFRSAA
ncbi:MAG: peptidylprolyl isomerase, partial [Chitinophagaceae bacterium]